MRDIYFFLDQSVSGTVSFCCLLLCAKSLSLNFLCHEFLSRVILILALPLTNKRQILILEAITNFWERRSLREVLELLLLTRQMEFPLSSVR